VPGALPSLPPLSDQAGRLIELGAHQIGGLSAAGLRAAAMGAEPRNALLVLHPDRAPASALASLLEHGGKPGFVVADMADVDQFSAIESAVLPAGPLYLVAGLHRGDEMANWSPDEALPAITAAARTPLTLGEGIQWLLQQPGVLERNHCFMTIGSRLRRANGALDARTPAVWISNGTGRDGAQNRNAPKVGWCWAGNRHSWLGFASAAGRIRLTAQASA
jgi:Family of unknown function (DUF5701)